MSLILAFFGLAMFAIAMLLAASQGYDRLPNTHLRFRQWHHAYAGLLLVIISYWWGGAPLRLFGAFLLIDDGFQHLWQAVVDRWAHASICYWIHDWAYRRWAWLRAMNRWLNRALGTRA